MFRLLRYITLICIVLALVSVGLAVSIGHLMPPGKQMITAFPRKDQWTRISLISLNRLLPANRYLPVQVSEIQWSDDGEYLTIIGSRNNRLRIYNMGYSPGENNRRWQVDYSAQYHTFNLSPDKRWLVIPGASPTDDFTIHHIDPESEFINLTNDANAFVGGYYQPYIQWTADSKSFVYNPSFYGVDASGNPIMEPADYQLVDVETGARETIVSGTVNNLYFVPGGRYLAYSVPHTPLLPSPNPDDYLMQEAFYVYDPVTKTTRHVIDGQITQWSWSPDGTKFAYIKPELDGEQFTPNYFKAPVRYSPYDLVDPHGRFVLYTSGGGSLFLGVQPGYNLRMGVLDLETGDDIPVDILQADYYNLNWLPDSASLLMTIYTDPSNLMMVSPGRFTQPAASTSYLVRLDGSAPVPLALDNDELIVVATPVEGYQMLLASGQYAGDFYIMNTTTGSIEKLELPPGEEYFYSAWSPDGHYLAVTTTVRPITTLTPRVSGTAISPKFTQVPGSLPTPTALGSIYIPTTPTFRTYLISYDNPTLRLIHEDTVPSSLYWGGKGSPLFLNNTNGRNNGIYILANPADPNDRLRPLYMGGVPGRLIYLSYNSWRPGT